MHATVDARAALTRRSSMGRAVLPALALASLAVPIAIVLAAQAAGTFGFDFLAYEAAARRIVAGQPLYDTSVAVTGGFGLFYYPPPFALLVAPLTIVSDQVAAWLWLALSAVALAAGIALLPVRASVRWTVLLLAGISWPVAYALKLGQVGPLLFLLFAVGWRWIDRPVAVGVTGALGAVVKVQPGLVLLWAVLTRRWRAAIIGAAVILVAIVASIVVLGGPSPWADFIAVLRNVSDPIRTPHNFTPGAVAFRLGLDPGLAAVLQVVNTVAVLALFIWSAVRLPAVVSYMVALIASQLISPVLWDHYALLLLLPIAWLIDSGATWAVALALLTSVLALPLPIGDVGIPVAFWATLIAVCAVGPHSRPTVASRRTATAIVSRS